MNHEDVSINSSDTFVNSFNFVQYSTYLSKH